MADRKAVRASGPPRTILCVRLRSRQPGSAASIVRCSGCRTASFSVADGSDAIGRDSRLHRRSLPGFRACVPRAMLYSSEPRSSEWPSMRTLMLGCCDRTASSFWTVGASVERIPPANLTMSGSSNCGSSPPQRVAHPVGRRLGAELDYALFSMPRHGASWLSSWMEP
jgi:hypothetical protein